MISRREVIGREGASLTPDEEEAKARLHELSTQLAAPPLNSVSTPLAVSINYNYVAEVLTCSKCGRKFSAETGYTSHLKIVYIGF